MPFPLLLGPMISFPEALDSEESLVGQAYYYAAKMVSYAYPGGQIYLGFYFSNLNIYQECQEPFITNEVKLINKTKCLLQF